MHKRNQDNSGYGQRSIYQEKITLDKKAQEEIGLVICLEHYIIWLRDLDTKKIGTEIFGEL